jgi:hypothetical protein
MRYRLLAALKATLVIMGVVAVLELEWRLLRWNAMLTFEGFCAVLICGGWYLLYRSFEVKQ